MQIYLYPEGMWIRWSQRWPTTTTSTIHGLRDTFIITLIWKKQFTRTHMKCVYRVYFCWLRLSISPVAFHRFSTLSAINPYICKMWKKNESLHWSAFVVVHHVMVWDIHIEHKCISSRQRHIIRPIVHLYTTYILCMNWWWCFNIATDTNEIEWYGCRLYSYEHANLKL